MPACSACGSNSPQTVLTVVVEWVTQAGPRAWLVRAAAQVGTTSVAATASRLAHLVVAAGDVSTATTLAAGPASSGTGSGATQAAPVAGKQASAQAGGLTFPSWWNGNCDTANYAAGAQQQWGRPVAAYPLSPGATWFGLEACGPRPGYGEGPDVGARFPGSSWGVLEWECVELSMRYMDLAWGVHPYPANGKDVVWNYASTHNQFNPSGPALEAISNNGNGPLPQAGDVLSYGATSSFGHTSVVTAVNVNTSGNGSVTVLEENASASGWAAVPVTSWVLGGYDGGVSGWLHNPGFQPVPSNARAAMRATDGSTRTFFGLDTSSPVFGSNWSYEGGGALGAPAVVSVPTASDHGSPLYIVTGLDHNVWIRSDAADWRSLSPFAVYCTGAPGATVVAQTPGSSGTYVLVVACRGADGALWYAQTPISTNLATLPSARAWWGLGGGITDAPAVVAVGRSGSLQSELTFLVNGVDGRVWTRTEASQWTATSLGCVNDLAAAAVLTTSLVSTFACEGPDHAVWITSNTGAGWSPPMSLGNWVLDSPGIVLSPTSFTVVAEGNDTAMWETTSPTGSLAFGAWTSDGGSLNAGVSATALLPSTANP